MISDGLPDLILWWISIAALGACHAYRAALQMKEFEEIDKITFDEPQTSQIIQFFAAEMKRA